MGKKLSFMAKTLVFCFHCTLALRDKTAQFCTIQSHLQTTWWQLLAHLKTIGPNLFPVCAVFTSSGPVRTTAVFALAVLLSTAHSSVCLALKKLTPGSGDWSICLHRQTHKDQWASAGVCMCVCVCVFLSALTSAPAIPVIWYLDPVVCKNIQCSLQSLQVQRKKKQERKRNKQKAMRLCFHLDVVAETHSKLCQSPLLLQYVIIPFLSPVRTHTLIPACWSREIVSGTPSWSRSSIAVTPTSYKNVSVFSILTGFIA